MKGKRLPQCDSPEEIFEKLVLGREKAWAYVIELHAEKLAHDIERKYNWQTRDFPLHFLELQAENVESVLPDIAEETWRIFRQKVEAGKFTFISHKKAYSYLVGIAENQIRKRIRALWKAWKRHQKESSLDATGDSYDDGMSSNLLYIQGGFVDEDYEHHLILKERMLEVVKAVEILRVNDDHWKIVILKYLHGYSNEEIAVMMVGYNENSVSSICSQVLKRLRNYLGKDCT